MAKHKPQKNSLASRGRATAGSTPSPQANFEQVLQLIDAAHARAFAAVYKELVGLYG
jgi:hypothetical protein